MPKWLKGERQAARSSIIDRSFDAFEMGSEGHDGGMAGVIRALFPVPVAAAVAGFHY